MSSVYARDLATYGVTVYPVLSDAPSRGAKRKMGERRIDPIDLDEPSLAAGSSTDPIDLDEPPGHRDASLQAMAEGVWAALDSFPEYQLQGKWVQRVLGGFGALGNPSSFHHPQIRTLRAIAKRTLGRHVFGPYCKLRFEAGQLDVLRLEALFDRLCLRAPHFGAVSRESWHRDLYEGRPLPRSLPGGVADEIFGGWINLNNDGVPQSLACILGSHLPRPSGHQAQGYAPIAPTEHAALDRQLAAQARTHGTTGAASALRVDVQGHVIVPPGHAVVFLQGVVHMVAPSQGDKTRTQPDLRLYIGHRLTTETVPLHRNTTEVIDTGGVPFLPSGQFPPMYSPNHYMRFALSSKYRDWGGTTFVQAALFQRETPRQQVYFVPGSRDNRNPRINQLRGMPSLSEMGLWHGWARYAAVDVRVLAPEPLFETDSRRRAANDAQR